MYLKKCFIIKDMIIVKSLPILDSDLISIDVTKRAYGEKSKATNGA